MAVIFLIFSVLTPNLTPGAAKTPQKRSYLHVFALLTPPGGGVTGRPFTRETRPYIKVNKSNNPSLGAKLMSVHEPQGARPPLLAYCGVCIYEI